GAWWRADHGDTDYVKGHQFGVTAKMNLVDNLQLFAGYSQYNSEDELDVRNWTAGVKWDIAPGLWVIAEHSKYLVEEDPMVDDDDNFGVTWIRMRRSF
ncbi:MAG TPA: hypothetical protein PLZ16_13600, partial [Gammaproteobacteria bacterium]|nr:hypothetical protein [Gammaproteobacteria bacterium]